MRRQSTRAEAVLWEQLRAGGIGGHKFRRQHPVGRFVLDFYCAEKRLCVEVDGPIHDRQTERDAARDAALASYNIYVLRIRNEDVFGDLEHALSRITAALAMR
jgi:very-short-patch-repair endonuclease